MEKKIEIKQVSNETPQCNSFSNVYKFLFGSIHTRLFHAVLKFGICDILDDGKPRNYKELAKITNTSEDGMLKILRYFSYHGLFIEDKYNLGTYSKGPHNNLYIKSSIFYDMAELFSGDSYYDLYRSIPDTFKNGYSGIPKSLNVNDTWDVLQSKENNVKFKGAMAGITLGIADDVLNNVDFSNSKIICDVGGSHGILVEQILKKYQNIEKAYNFDLEKVISTVPKSKDSRLNHVSGDFFEWVPAADSYILRFIIHDWPDNECIKILNVISKSMLPGGKIYIFDSIIDHNNLDLDSLWIDIKMFHFFNSSERRLDEFKTFIEKTDFKIEKVYSIKCGGLLLTKR